MTDLRLRPMTDDELARFLVTSKAGYARQMHELGDMPLADAQAKADSDMARSFPEGKVQDGHRVLVAEAEREVVGHLWLAPANDRMRTAFIYDVEVDEAHRGKGYGRAIMRAAEDQARDMGMDAVALNVFGGNAVAIGLYSSLGYTVTAQNMLKPLQTRKGS